MSKIVPPGVVCPPASATATMRAKTTIIMSRMGAKRAIGDFIFLLFWGPGGRVQLGYWARRVGVR